MLPAPCNTSRDTKRAYCCVVSSYHSNASSHQSWQGPVGCHTAQVNSSHTDYSTEANHSIYFMCCHMWVSSSQPTATYKHWFCLLLVWYFCLVTPLMNKRSPPNNITSLAEPYRRAQNVRTINAAVVVYTHCRCLNLENKGLHNQRERHTHHVHY